MEVEVKYYFSPVGWLKLSADCSGLKSIEFSEAPVNPDKSFPRNQHLIQTIGQLDEYFNKKRSDFDVVLNPDGTAFQKQVWEMLKEIPFGETTTYGELARKMGKPGAMRAIGRANGTNKIPLIIPCHRVIGSDGSLTGFGGGIAQKRWLLDHERQTKASELF